MAVGGGQQHVEGSCIQSAYACSAARIVCALCVRGILDVWHQPVCFWCNERVGQI